MFVSQPDRKVAMRHITEIRPGDTVIHLGLTRTVCRCDIHRGFMGLTMFGDSYRLGSDLVIVVMQ